MKCWICNTNEANSQEHKFKKSLLKSFFGSTVHKDTMYMSQAKSLALQGINNKKVKFEKVICDICNNSRTSAHDNAFHQAITWVLLNYDNLYNSKALNFKEIFGARWQQKKLDFLKFIAKHAGCKIITSDHLYDITPLSNFIINNSPTNRFHVHFVIKEILFILDLISLKQSSNGLRILSNGKTISYTSNDGIPQWCSGSINTNWFSIMWIYTSAQYHTVNNNLDDHSSEIEIFQCDELVLNRTPEQNWFDLAEDQNMTNDLEWFRYFSKFVSQLD